MSKVYYKVPYHRIFLKDAESTMYELAMVDNNEWLGYTFISPNSHYVDVSRLKLWLPISMIFYRNTIFIPKHCKSRMLGKIVIIDNKHKLYKLVDALYG